MTETERVQYNIHMLEKMRNDLELTYKEMGEILGTNPNTLKNMVRLDRPPYMGTYCALIDAAVAYYEKRHLKHPFLINPDKLAPFRGVLNDVLQPIC